jgi:hypothetical protein
MAPFLWFRYLDLSNNQLSGGVPATLGSLATLSCVWYICGALFLCGYELLAAVIAPTTLASCSSCKQRVETAQQPTVRKHPRGTWWSGRSSVRARQQPPCLRCETKAFHRPRCLVSYRVECLHWSRISWRAPSPSASERWCCYPLSQSIITVCLRFRNQSSPWWR